MNEKDDKQRQSLLGEDYKKNRELPNESAKLHSQTVGSRGPVLNKIVYYTRPYKSLFMKKF